MNCKATKNGKAHSAVWRWTSTNGIKTRRLRVAAVQEPSGSERKECQIHEVLSRRREEVQWP